MVGSVVTLPAVWSFADIANGADGDPEPDLADRPQRRDRGRDAALPVERRPRADGNRRGRARHECLTRPLAAASLPSRHEARRLAHPRLHQLEATRMKVLVFGGNGKMGAAVAFDLLKDDAVEKVGLVARRKDALEKTREWLKSDRVVIHPLDIMDKAAIQRLMKQYDVGVNTLPDRRTSYKTVARRRRVRLPPRRHARGVPPPAGPLRDRGARAAARHRRSRSTATGCTRRRSRTASASWTGSASRRASATSRAARASASSTRRSRSSPGSAAFPGRTSRRRSRCAT